MQQYDRYGIALPVRPKRKLTKVSKRIKVTRSTSLVVRMAEIPLPPAHQVNPSWSGTRCNTCQCQITWAGQQYNHA